MGRRAARPARADNSNRSISAQHLPRFAAGLCSFDAKALAWSLEGIEQSHDQLLQPIERTFFYLPLEHSERLEHQERSVRMFGELVPLVAAEQKEIFEHYLNVAILHRDIIARFGRFPHRNQILGRSSTAEELYFLSQPGSSF